MDDDVRPTLCLWLEVNFVIIKGSFDFPDGLFHFWRHTLPSRVIVRRYRPEHFTFVQLHGLLIADLLEFARPLNLKKVEI